MSALGISAKVCWLEEPIRVLPLCGFLIMSGSCCSYNLCYVNYISLLEFMVDYLLFAFLLSFLKFSTCSCALAIQVGTSEVSSPVVVSKEPMRQRL